MIYNLLYLKKKLLQLGELKSHRLRGDSLYGNNRNFYNFIDFSTHCNYFYKLGSKKGKCCEKEIVCNELFCNEHKNSIFIDKKKIIIKNMDYFNISN